MSCPLKKTEGFVGDYTLYNALHSYDPDYGDPCDATTEVSISSDQEYFLLDDQTFAMDEDGSLVTNATSVLGIGKLSPYLRPHSMSERLGHHLVDSYTGKQLGLSESTTEIDILKGCNDRELKRAIDALQSMRLEQKKLPNSKERLQRVAFLENVVGKFAVWYEEKGLTLPVKIKEQDHFGEVPSSPGMQKRERLIDAYVKTVNTLKKPNPTHDDLVGESGINRTEWNRSLKDPSFLLQLIDAPSFQPINSHNF